VFHQLFLSPAHRTYIFYPDPMVEMTMNTISTLYAGNRWTEWDII